MTPFRLLDPSGRSLIWVKFHSKRVSFIQSSFDSPNCLLRLCPRPDDSVELIGNRPKRSGSQTPDLISRPCFSDASVYFRLRDDVHQWLEDHHIPYQIELRYANGDNEPGWHLGFLPNQADLAVMFKLTWCNDVDL